MFTFKSGNTRADIVAEFKSALKERNTTERLAAMGVVQKEASKFGTWSGSRAVVRYTDRMGYASQISSPNVVEQTGNTSYAFQNCMSAILQGFSPMALTDEQFGDMLAVMLNSIQRDSHTFYCLPTDYQLVDGAAKHHKSCQKGDFLDRWIHELGALEIDRTPNMYHAPSYGVMFRLCLLYNPNILKYLDCIPYEPWDHDTSTRKHFQYVPKYRVDAELAKPVETSIDAVKSTPEKADALLSRKVAAKAARVPEFAAFGIEGVNAAPTTNARTSF